MMASESCSTSSSSSGDDFVPIFFASQSNEVTPWKLRQEAEYGDETDAAAAEAQSGENESDPDFDFVSACFSSGEHILVSVRRVLREGSKTRLRCCFD